MKCFVWNVAWYFSCQNIWHTVRKLLGRLAWGCG
jgi:hypothetical protein